MTQSDAWQLPENWAWTTIGEVRLDASTTITPSRTPANVFELYSVPSYDEGSPEVVPGENIGSSKHTVQTDTVLLCKINPRINRVWIVRGQSPHIKIASTEWIPFFPLDGLEPGYLQYFMRQDAFRDHLALRASGVGGSLMRVKPGTFSDYPFPFAPLAEQRRIVAEIEAQFTRLDAAVAALKRVQARLRRYKASVLKAACEGRLVPTEAELARAEGRGYEPAGVLLQRILAERRAKWEAEHPGKRYREPEPPDTSELPELPGGWVWATLPQMGLLARGKSKHRPRDDERLFGGPYPFIQTGEVSRADGTITSYSQTYSNFGLAQSHLWSRGTLCITIAANIAATALLDFDACFPDSVVGFVPESGADVRFVEYFMRTAKQELERYAPATAQKNINLATLGSLAVPFPPAAEQQRIVAEVERCLSVAQELERQVGAALRRADRLRQSILKSAFEGRLVPQDPSDEPASVLLERIRAERGSRRGEASRGAGSSTRQAPAKDTPALLLELPGMPRPKG